MKYTAYKLTLQSDIQLELPQAEAMSPPDITIRIDEIPQPKSLSRTYDGVWYAHGENQLYLRWDRICEFLIRNGNEIILYPSKENPPTQQLLSAPLMGTVMAVAMHQKEMTTLHGSSVDVHGKAVIFLGEKGEGKSTFAGHFQKEGSTLISDDICSLHPNNAGKALIAPSFPTIKLWPDAMEHLNLEPINHKRIHPELEKRRILLTANFASSFLEMSAIVVLATGLTPIIERLKGHEVLPILLPHLIINRFPENQPEHLIKTTYFQLTGLIKNTPIYQLTRPRDISLLPTLSKLVRDNT